MPDRFDDEFWPLCPRKKGKGAARRAWAKAVKTVEPDQIIDAMRQFRRECIGKEPEFICHPATWLNQERWEDEPDKAIEPSKEQSLEGAAWKIRHGASDGHRFPVPRDQARACIDAGLVTEEQAEPWL